VVPDWAFSGNVILLVGWNFLDVNLKGSTSLIIFYICFATAHVKNCKLDSCSEQTCKCYQEPYNVLPSYPSVPKGMCPLILEIVDAKLCGCATFRSGTIFHLIVCLLILYFDAMSFIESWCYITKISLYLNLRFGSFSDFIQSENENAFLVSHNINSFVITRAYLCLIRVIY
jgi:hypothetical protein